MSDRGPAHFRREDVQHWLLLAERAASAGAKALAAAGAQGGEVVREEGRETKIVGDLTSEEAVISVLRASSPFGLLSEEAGEVEAGSAGGARWIVDPLDGSLNYHRGIPLSAVSVALWVGDEPLIGVLNDPRRGDVYTGVVGQGAWLNGAPIRTSEIDAAENAVLCTGFPVSMETSVEAIHSHTARVRAFKKVRMLGSAALSLALCGVRARGRVLGRGDQAVGHRGRRRAGAGGRRGRANRTGPAVSDEEGLGR